MKTYKLENERHAEDRRRLRIPNDLSRASFSRVQNNSIFAGPGKQTANYWS